MWINHYNNTRPRAENFTAVLLVLGKESHVLQKHKCGSKRRVRNKYLNPDSFLAYSSFILKSLLALNVLKNAVTWDFFVEMKIG